MISDLAPNMHVLTDPRVTRITTHNELRKYLDREWKFRASGLRSMLRFCLKGMGKG